MKELNREDLETYAALSLSLHRTRYGLAAKGGGFLSWVALSKRREVWDCFAAFPLEVIMQDSIKVWDSDKLDFVFGLMEEADFWPNDAREYACGLCLFAAIIIRGYV